MEAAARSRSSPAEARMDRGNGDGNAGAQPRGELPAVDGGRAPTVEDRGLNGESRSEPQQPQGNAADLGGNEVRDRPAGLPAMLCAQGGWSFKGHHNLRQ